MSAGKRIGESSKFSNAISAGIMICVDIISVGLDFDKSRGSNELRGLIVYEFECTMVAEFDDIAYG